MKSINDKSRIFTIEDFEKGLMLAGLVSPTTTRELAEREALEEYRKTAKKGKSSTYFKRVVLAAEIASELHAERTFGRVKFQKLVYICEHVAEMNLEDRYSKLAAGPFDNKFMHTVHIDFKKNKWFSVEKIKEGGITRSIYKPLENTGAHKSYYNSYYGSQNASIKKIIDLFRSSKTDIAEIAATLIACNFELSRKRNQFFYTEIEKLFYEWSKQKQRFNSEKIRNVWIWMVENGIVEDVIENEATKSS